jgi:hypothetical protein
MRTKHENFSHFSGGQDLIVTSVDVSKQQSEELIDLKNSLIYPYPFSTFDVRFQSTFVLFLNTLNHAILIFNIATD